MIHELLDSDDYPFDENYATQLVYGEVEPNWETTEDSWERYVPELMIMVWPEMSPKLKACVYTTAMVWKVFINKNGKTIDDIGVTSTELSELGKEEYATSVLRASIGLKCHDN